MLTNKTKMRTTMNTKSPVFVNITKTARKTTGKKTHSVRAG